jgi:hypothetical protein
MNARSRPVCAEAQKDHDGLARGADEDACDSFDRAYRNMMLGISIQAEYCFVFVMPDVTCRQTGLDL